MTSLALLHRRLAAGMALSALVAFAAGEGSTPAVLLAGTALLAALFWHPGPEGSARLEWAARAGILVLFAWMMYVAFVLAADFMPAVLWMLLFLLVTESLRSLDARNDMRLYSLSFALLIAATAYYPGVLFALAFVVYVALTTLAMMVGFLRRQTETLGVAEIRVDRRFMGATAALSGITLLVSVVLFVVFPRLPRAWNVQGRAGGGERMAGFTDRVSLGAHGSRISSNPTIQFRVEFPDGRMPPQQELYWRGRSFDRFDGARWMRSLGTDVVSPRGEWYRTRWPGPEREQRIYGGPPGASVLFGLTPVLGVQARSAIRPLRDLTGDMPYFGSDEPVYTVTSGPPSPPAAALADGPSQAFPVGWAYLQLPPLSPRVKQLADSLAGGQPTQLARVEAIRRYLAAGPFHYTLELPRDSAEATIEGFLFRRRAGHCEYFSTAMAVLLRAEGIPAREVNGFQGGDWNESGRYLAVTGNDAHAWVEVFFPGAGWVPFDPTPPGERQETVGQEQAASWVWPARFWLDGVEHRWYKWVLDYNLDKQLGLLRDAGSFFSGGRGRGSQTDGRGGGGRGALPWIVGAGAVVLVFWLGRRRKGARVTEEGRTYLALRRLYTRWGGPRPAGETPLDFAQALEAMDAPGARSARQVIDLYLRARFGGERIGDEGRRAMLTALEAARQAVRRAGRRRPPSTERATKKRNERKTAAR